MREAVTRQYRESEYQASPIILGVDVARFGSDSSVIFRRQGLVAFEPIVIRKFDNMAVADRVAIEIAAHKPAAVFIDAGNGQGVIDRLHQLRFPVTEVAFGGSAIDGDHYANRRIEMWDKMNQWLRAGGAIPPSEVLQADLSAPTYGFTIGKNLKILESKDKIKERIGRSPDLADALALTFAAPVSPTLSARFERQIYGSADEAYDPVAEFDRMWRG